MIGGPRRARGPPVDFGDKLFIQPSWYTFTPPRGPGDIFSSRLRKHRERLPVTA